MHKHGQVAEQQTTVEAIIEARRGKAALSRRFERTLPPNLFDRFITIAEDYPSPEGPLEDKILRATIEAAAKLDGFEPLPSSLNSRLAAILREVDSGNLGIIFPDQ